MLQVYGIPKKDQNVGSCFETSKIFIPSTAAKVYNFSEPYFHTLTDFVTRIPKHAQNIIFSRKHLAIVDDMRGDYEAAE